MYMCLIFKYIHNIKNIRINNIFSNTSYVVQRSNVIMEKLNSEELYFSLMEIEAFLGIICNIQDNVRMEHISLVAAEYLVKIGKILNQIKKKQIKTLNIKHMLSETYSSKTALASLMMRFNCLFEALEHKESSLSI